VDDRVTIHVRAGGAAQDYTVWIETEAAERLPTLVRRFAPAHRFAVISDANVAELYGSSIVDRFSGAATLHVFGAGEASKSRTTWIRLTDELLDAGHGRDSTIVALGGGVTGDLAGFVAATYMRGVPVVQVPTTTLAMVDAAVGGKTGVNAVVGKNLVGAFHPPSAVVVDPAFTKTLAPTVRAEGAVEALKHGAIADATYFRAVATHAGAIRSGDIGATRDMVVTSVRIKAKVVSEDERESGLRAVLNFGHTIGHAIERVDGYAGSHGRAVALGMVLEARVGELLGRTAPGTSDELRDALDRLRIPLSARLDAGALIEAMRSDKKGRRSEPRFVLLDRIGEVRSGDGWTHSVPNDIVARAIETGF
jgi:3-dehydroquinate synthase